MPIYAMKNHDSPLRLKLLVNVLPQPGTGQVKFASCFRLLWLAFAVRPVVTVGFDTTMD